MLFRSPVSRLISAEQVINTIKKIPTFRPAEKAKDEKAAGDNATARDPKEGKHKK